MAAFGARLTSPILWAAGITALTFCFARLQNAGHLVGGNISLPKSLWLNLTILCFFVLPALWWRDRLVERRMRIVFGTIFASFVLRAAVELPMLYLTDWWRCSYGIAHDLSTASVALALFARARSGGVPDQRHSGSLLWFIVLLLVVEAGFAYAFCSVADPAAGIYFAGEEATFRSINRVTWLVVAGAYPVLAVLLWKAARVPRREALPSTTNPG